MVPESNISFNRISTRFVSLALFFRLEVIGVFDSKPSVFGLTCSSAEKEPDLVEAAAVVPLMDDGGDPRRSLS